MIIIVILPGAAQRFGNVAVSGGIPIFPAVNAILKGVEGTAIGIRIFNFETNGYDSIAIRGLDYLCSWYHIVGDVTPCRRSIYVYRDISCIITWVDIRLN